MKWTTAQVVFREFPDEVTLAINISGCPNQCEGCHSPHLRKNIGKKLDFTAVDNLINEHPQITCIGLMGGDADPHAIADIARHIKETRFHIKVGWYSGCNHVPEDMNIDFLDYIKVGGYVPERGPLDNPNTNQRMMMRVGNTWVDITYKFWKNK